MKTTTFHQTIIKLPKPNPLTYQACFFEKGLAYTVVLPDFNGVLVEADGYDKAKTKAQKALQQTINAMMLTDRPVPVPTPLEKINPQQIALAQHIHFRKCLIVPLGFHFESNS